MVPTMPGDLRGLGAVLAEDDPGVVLGQSQVDIMDGQ